MIDVHVLTHEGTRKDWLDQCLKSLEGHPCTVHVVDNAGRSVGEGRSIGYQLGTHEFVTFVDSDDYILEGSIQACIDAMQEHRSVVTREIREYPDGSRFPFPMMGHNMAVYRRSDLAPFFSAMRDSPHCSDVWTRRMLQPTQIEFIAYAWRVHAGGDHHKTTRAAVQSEGNSWLSLMEQQ